MKNDLQPSAVIEGVEVFPILGYEGRYSVSKCGRVWSHDRIVVNGKGEGNRRGRGAWVSRQLKGRWVRPQKMTNGYCFAPLSSNGKIKGPMVHRIVARTFLGIPDGFEVDHVNGDKTDNRLENLRVATRLQNSVNRGPTRRSSSRFKGVHFAKRDRRWVAGIRLHGKTTYLGVFGTEEEAARAYDRAAKKLHGEFFCPNSP